MDCEKNYTVLVCDDEENVLINTKGLLDLEDYNVLTCNNGKDAVDIVRNSKVHILLLDYFMPGFTGEQVVEEVRKFDAEVFIIINTGFAEKIPPRELMKKIKIQAYNSKKDSIDRFLMTMDIAANVCEQHETIKELFNLSITDGLTGIFNRRYMLELGEKELASARRYDRTLSVLMTDIDFFKKFNDKYGHNIGDQVLKAVARVLTNSVRQNIDVVGRYGGEEFGVILPETGLESAKQLAERLRKNVEQLRLVEQYSELAVTISIGVATINDEETLNDAFKRADEMLYKAKENGRNRVEG